MVDRENEDPLYASVEEFVRRFNGRRIITKVSRRL